MKLAASMGKCSRPDQTEARTRGNRAISKYSMGLAEQIRQMRNDGRKRFDILLVEDLSRLSRQVAESESLIHRLESRFSSASAPRSGQRITS